jgi:hypothetical protein
MNSFITVSVFSPSVSFKPSKIRLYFIEWVCNFNKDQLYVDGVWYPNGNPPQNQPTTCIYRPIRTTETIYN